MEQDFLFWLKKLSLELPQHIDLTGLTALLTAQQGQITTLQEQATRQTLLLQTLERQMQQQEQMLARLLDANLQGTAAAQTTQAIVVTRPTQPSTGKRRMLIEPTPEDLEHLATFFPTLKDHGSMRL